MASPQQQNDCSLTNKQKYIEAIETNEKLFLQSLVDIQKKLYANPTSQTENRDVSEFIEKLKSASDEITRNINLLKQCPVNNEDIKKIQEKSKTIENMRNKLQNSVAEINRTNNSIIFEKENENKKWLYLNISLAIFGTSLLIYGFTKMEAKN